MAPVESIRYYTLKHKVTGKYAQLSYLGKWNRRLTKPRLIFTDNPNKFKLKHIRDSIKDAIEHKLQDELKELELECFEVKINPVKTISIKQVINDAEKDLIIEKLSGDLG